MPIDFKALQDLYTIMWWIRGELDAAKLNDEPKVKHWQDRYDTICRVAKFAFRHVPLVEAIENSQRDLANNANWYKDVEELLAHYRKTC